MARAVGCAPPAQILAAAWTLVYRNLNFFALTGMETGPAALVLTAGLIGVVHGVRTGRGSVASMWWTAPAILLRPEMAAFAVYAGAVQFVMLERRRWRPVIGLAIGLAICGGYVLWRRSYYGEWLPNTYVLKLTQWPFSDRMRAASRYLPWTLASLGPFALAGLTSIKHWRGSRFWLLWIVPVLGIAYQFYVGGYYERTDRFAVPFGPTLFVAAAAGVVHISRYVRQLGFGVRRVWVVWAAGLLMVAPMNAAALNPILKGVGTWKVMEGSLRNWRAAIIINRHAAPDATIAVTWAGTVPYITGRTCRDILGRCDRDIARLPAHLGLYPGHNKFDVSWTVRTYEPDIIDDTSDAVIATAAVKANYVPMRFELDGEPVYLLVRKYTHRITGGVAIAWRELPRDNP